MPAYTWTTGETITAAKLQALENEAWRIANQIAYNSSTAATSTTSSSYVDGAASVTFTAKSTSVYIQAQGGGFGCLSSGTTAYAYLAININGTDYPVSHSATQAGQTVGSFCGGVVVTGLTAGTSYTAKLRLARSVNTAYLNFGGIGVSPGPTIQSIAVFEIAK